MNNHKLRELGTAMASLVGMLMLVVVIYALTAVRSEDGRDSGVNKEITPGSALPGTEGRRGFAVYNKVCVVCHAAGAANAPKLGDKVAWGRHIAGGIDQLLKAVTAGKGAMPPRGACMDCSDDDLKAAIEYMLAQVSYESAAPSGVGGPRGDGGASRVKGASGPIEQD